MSDVVFIINIKDPTRLHRSLPYDFSVKSWKRWAEQYNIDVMVLDEWIYPRETMNANWHATLVFDLLEESGVDYNQILVVDADTIPHPDAPNPFDISEGKFCAVHCIGSYDWICRSLENYSKFLFNGYTFPLEEYFNSGFYIMNKSHKGFFKKLHDFYFENIETIQWIQNNYGVGTDQPVLNFMVQQENIDLKILPFDWNMQDLARWEILSDDMLFTKFGYVYHFNAIPNNHDGKYTRYFMEKTYNYLYGND